MEERQWRLFAETRTAYRRYVDELAASTPELRAAQQQLADERDGGGFLVETPVVYNAALDAVGPADEIRLILVADNPGRREQEAANRRYLVGPSGKLADNFFRAHPELGIDFKHDVLILNKTPIHTPRTGELRELARLGGEKIAAVIIESQKTMVDIILRFHIALNPTASAPNSAASALPLWIIGYSELGRGKLFEPFAAAFTAAYRSAEPKELRDAVGLFRHFSMNQFNIDFKRQAAAGGATASGAAAGAATASGALASGATIDETTNAALRRIGADYRKRCLGW